MNVGGYLNILGVSEKSILFPKEITWPIKLSQLLTACVETTQNSMFNVTIFLFTQPLRSGRIWHKVNF